MNSFEWKTSNLRIFIDFAQKGEINVFEINGVPFIHRYWMHSSSEGAADGSNLGFEMRLSDVFVFNQLADNKISIEGRQCQSNGSGYYFGHWYRWTYTFYPWGMNVHHDQWISPQDIEDAKKKGFFALWDNRPPMFYVWAIPVDCYREAVTHWNCSWDRCWDTDYYDKPIDNYKWGEIPQIGNKPWNRGYTSFPELSAKPIHMTLFKPGGFGLKREIVSIDKGTIDQLNVWRNPNETPSYTAEISMVGGDKSLIVPQAKYLTPFCKESYDRAPQSQRDNAYPRVRQTNPVWSENLIAGRVDGAGNLVPFS